MSVRKSTRLLAKASRHVLSSSDDSDEEYRVKSRTIKRSSPKQKGPELVTPPKQRKLENDENSSATPSTLLRKLSLMNSEEKNRRKLFEDDIYVSARKALHSMCPTMLPGREKELNDLNDFISKHVKEKTSGSLYISGPPGTGKTASLNLILQDESISGVIQKIYVNCTSIKSSGAIFSRIAKNLVPKCVGKTEKDFIGIIEKFLWKGSHKKILLVLDEIDQLESKKQSVLYTLFEWPSIPNSNLILIGIANALDLTDRILPRLQVRCELKPELMHFAPYTKKQIIEIFTNRLEKAGVVDIFSPIALQVLAGKVAAISGDVRRALDIGRRVIELIDNTDKSAKVLQSVENLADLLDDSGKTTTKIETVDMTKVMTVLNNVYGTTNNFDDDVSDNFPLQQKLIICSLLLILKKSHNKDVTIGRLHDVYRKVCGRRNIQIVDQGEFVGLCSLIETRGILKVTKKKDPRMNKVSLVWDEEEVGTALRDKVLMAAILEDNGCLTR